MNKNGYDIGLTDMNTNTLNLKPKIQNFDLMVIVLT